MGQPYFPSRPMISTNTQIWLISDGLLDILEYSKAEKIIRPRTAFP